MKSGGFGVEQWVMVTLPEAESRDVPTSAPSETFQPRRATPRAWFQAGFFAALGAALLILLAWLCWHLSKAVLAVLAPFVLGGALALLLDPLVSRLERGGLNRTLATGVVFVGLLLILFAFGYVVVPALIHQATDLAQNGPPAVTKVQDWINAELSRHHRIGSYQLPRNVGALWAQISQRASVLLQKSAGTFTGFLIGSVTTLIQMILALVVAFFLLADLKRLRARLFYLAPERVRAPIGQLSRDIGGVFSDYLRGLIIVCALYGVATILLLYGLSLLHHDLAKYALLVGAAAGILYAVPYIGSTTTALVTFLVAFAAGGAGFGGIAVAATLALNQVFDNVVTPRVVGGGVGLHPVVALFALVLGGELFGLWGMLLSVPIAASIQVILFRLFPKLTTPTPAEFLRRQGVPPGETQSAKIDEGDKSLTAQEKREDKERQARTPQSPR